jgi:hypothetical protein
MWSAMAASLPRAPPVARLSWQKSADGPDTSVPARSASAATHPAHRSAARRAFCLTLPLTHRDVVHRRCRDSECCHPAGAARYAGHRHGRGPGRDNRVGVSGSGDGSKALDPRPVLSGLRRLCFSGWPRWFRRDHYVDRAGACPAARQPRGMCAVRAPLAKGGMAVLIVVTVWRCRSMSGFGDGSADGSAFCSEVL